MIFTHNGNSVFRKERGKTVISVNIFRNSVDYLQNGLRFFFRKPFFTMYPGFSVGRKKIKRIVPDHKKILLCPKLNLVKVKKDLYYFYSFCQIKRDAEREPQALAFRPAGNSPSLRHFTRALLLFDYY
jgi:hypothetical protein